MHDVKVLVRSWKGDSRTDDGEQGSCLLRGYVTVDGREIAGSRVSLEFGEVHLWRASEFVVLVIENPPVEVFRRFDSDTWLMGTDENRLLLAVRSIEFEYEPAEVLA